MKERSIPSWWRGSRYQTIWEVTPGHAHRLVAAIRRRYPNVRIAVHAKRDGYPNQKGDFVFTDSFNRDIIDLYGTNYFPRGSNYTIKLRRRGR